MSQSGGPLSFASRLLVTLLLAATPVLAAAQVSCVISATGADFGDYDIFRAAPTDVLASVTLGCTLLPGQSSSGGPIRFELSASPGLGGALSPWRQMQRGSARLDYNLYTDFNRTTIWGDGTGGSLRIFGQLRTLNQPNPSATTSVTLYGRIRPLQVVPVGLYRDTIVVTMLF